MCPSQDINTYTLVRNNTAQVCFGSVSDPTKDIIIFVAVYVNGKAILEYGVVSGHPHSTV